MPDPRRPAKPKATPARRVSSSGQRTVPRPATPTAAKAAHAKAGRARRRRGTVVVLLLGLALVAVLFAFVYPTRTFVAQRHELQATQRRLEVLHTSTLALKQDSARLQSDAEVERRAREDYGLTRPGETPYVLVPAPPTTIPWVP